MVRILGIDPGLQNMGWGIIESSGNQLTFIGCGSLHSDRGDNLAERLKTLHDRLSEILDHYKPEEAAVEETFINRDPRTSLKLGQARGIALLVPALKGAKVAEYAANLIKKTLTGTGHAEKNQIEWMIKLLLPQAQPKTKDAADALAVAITHAQHRSYTAARAIDLTIKKKK